MITDEQYKLIEPHREDIIKFQSTKSLRNPHILNIVNEVQQRHGMGAINFGCTGCKVQAMIDIYNMMVEYEQANKPI